MAETTPAPELPVEPVPEAWGSPECIGGDMRRRLHDNQFRCLPSFLYELVQQYWADEAGVVAVRGADVVLKRAARRDGGPLAFDRVRGVVGAATAPAIDPKVHTDN